MPIRTLYSIGHIYSRTSFTHEILRIIHYIINLEFFQSEGLRSCSRSVHCHWRDISSKGVFDGETRNEIAREYGRSIRKILEDAESVCSLIEPEPSGFLPLMARILPEGSAKFFAASPAVDRERSGTEKRLS